MLFMYEFITNFITHFFNNSGIRDYLVFIIAAFGFGGLFRMIWAAFTNTIYKG